MHKYSEKILALFNGNKTDESQGVELLRSIGPMHPAIAFDFFTLPNPWETNQLPRLDDSHRLIWEMIGWILDQGTHEDLQRLHQIEVLPVHDIHQLHPKLDLLRLERCVIDLTTVRWFDIEQTPVSLSFSKPFKNVRLSNCAGVPWIENWLFESLTYLPSYNTELFFDVDENNQDLPVKCQQFCQLLRGIGSRERKEKQLEMLLVSEQSHFHLKTVKGFPVHHIDKLLMLAPYLDSWECATEREAVNGNFPFLEYGEPTLNWDAVHKIDEIRWGCHLFSGTWGKAPKIELYLKFDMENTSGTLRERLIEAQLEYIQYDFSIFPNLQKLKVWNPQATALNALHKIPSHIDVEILNNLNQIIDSIIQHHRNDARTRGERYERDWLDEPEHLYHSSKFQIANSIETRLLLGLGYPSQMNCSGNRYTCLEYLLTYPKEANIPFGSLLPGSSTYTFSTASMDRLCSDLSDEGYLVLDRMVRLGLRNVPEGVLSQMITVLQERGKSTDYYEKNDSEVERSKDHLERYLELPFTEENIRGFISHLDPYCDMKLLEAYLDHLDGVSEVAIQACLENDFYQIFMEDGYSAFAVGVSSTPTLIELILRLYDMALQYDSEDIALDGISEWLRAYKDLLCPLEEISAWLRHYKQYPSERCASYLRQSCEQIFANGRLCIKGWSKELVRTMLQFVPKSLWYVELIACELDEIPMELFRLSQLERLILYHNKLTTIPEDIQRLPALNVLSVSMNPDMVIPQTLASHPTLTRGEVFTVYAKNIASTQEHKSYLVNLEIDLEIDWG